MRARTGFRLLAVAGAALTVAALVLALRPFHLFRDFTPSDGRGDKPTWVWTIPCGGPLEVSLDRSEELGLDPACYEQGPRKLVLPVGVAALGLAAVAIALFGHRKARSAGNDGPLQLEMLPRRIAVIAGAAVVVAAAFGMMAPSVLGQDKKIVSLNDRLRPGDFVVPLGDQPSRYYQAHVPRSVRRPAPVLVVLHGSNSRAGAVAGSTGLSAFADAHNVLVVYPQATKYRVEGFGTGGYWNVAPCSFGPTSCWNPATIERPDDVRYIRDVIADVKRRADVDTKRIYVIGHSLGGAMAGRLGCEAADVISGVVVLNSSMETEPCRPRRPLPVLIFHTADDDVVPPKGNRYYKPLMDSIDAWRTANRCQGPGSKLSEEDFTRTTYGDCAGDVTVEVVNVSTGGHDWVKDPTFDWRAGMWNFFSSED